MQKIEKRILMLGDAIVVVSNSLRDYLLRSGIPASKIHVVPNAANPRTFDPHIDGNSIRRKWGIDNKVVVGFVGGFSSWHGMDVLLAAASDIIKKVQNIHFLLVGEGKMRKPLEKFARDNCLSEYVTFTGNVLYEEVPNYVAAMDITVMPCSNTYGSPIKVFEYMAMGKPVIAPKLGPVEEIIVHGREGLLINPEIKDELEETILCLCSDEALRNKMGMNGRRAILRHYTWVKNAERVVGIFSSLRKS